VTGKSDSSCVTIKFDPFGNQRWLAEIKGDYKNKFPSIFLHPNGNVYILETGTIVSYDPQGNKVLQKDFSGSTFIFDQKGNLFAVSADYDFDQSYIVITKYDQYGNLNWSGKIDSAYYHDYYFPTAVETDSLGNIFITGGFEDEMSFSQLFVSKFDTAGHFQWFAQHSDSTFGDSQGNAIGITNNGNVCVTCTKNSYTNIEYMTLLYDEAGTLRWSKKIGGIDLTIDHMDNIYVCGATGTTKCNVNGDIQWSIPFTANHIILDDKGNIFLSKTITWDVGSGILIAKLQQTPTFVNTTQIELPSSFALFQNYPNPFNPSTVISYQLPVTSRVSIKISDLLGRELATLVNEEQSAGWKKVEWNASRYSSGIYFLTMCADNFSQTKKLVLMK